MLIIPIQSKPDWRRPPLVCFALIVVNLLMFLLYQGGDDARWQQAEEYYFASQLPVREETRLLQFIDQRHPEWRGQAEAEGEDFIYQQLLWNRDFHQWLLPQLQAEDEGEWLAEREQFAQLRDRLSSYALGLTPAEPSLAGLFGHMFLHGGWEHILGNMIFLLLFGLSVEMALGARWFLAFYLLGGLGAAAAHMLVEAGSPVPMIGASGAVSAVMGMFVAIYGLRKLRFFYTVGFAFGEFTAPALLVLPLWLGKEIFGYYFGDSHIAYWAHFGGLAAGCLLALPLTRFRPLHELQAAQIAQPLPEAGALARIEALQSQGKLVEAGGAALAALRQYPHSLPLIQTAIALTAAAPESEAYHRANLALFALAKNPAADSRPIATGYREYLQKSPNPRALTEQACLLLANRATQEKDWPWLEDLLRRLHAKRSQHPLLAQLAMQLVNHYRRSGDESRAREAQQLVPGRETSIA